MVSAAGTPGRSAITASDFMDEERIITIIDEIVDGMNPDTVEELVADSDLTFSQVMERITNELKARLVISETAINRRNCPNCGQSNSYHTGSYCNHCGETL